LLDDASERSRQFSAIDKDIAAAVKNGLRKYKKYYTFIDAMDTYYPALILDPRVKGGLILQELRDDDDSGRLILQAIRNELHLAYQVTEPAVTELHPPPIYGGDDDLESRMLRRLRPADSPKVSDIDRYFDTVRVVVSDTKQPNWLCDWWRRNKDEYPQWLWLRAGHERIIRRITTISIECGNESNAENMCCAVHVLASQPDLRAQISSIEEIVVGSGHMFSLSKVSL
ncbi:hypothetical protein V1524DRAFT_412297, partial [Lipomyces starkeyi]